jgi:hypothetical protein
MKPTWRDVMLLVALQAAASLACTLLLAVLGIADGSQNWVSIIGAMMGAQVFGILREKKRPGFVVAHKHQLALSSTLFQVAIALGAVVASKPPAGEAKVSTSTLIVLMSVAGLLSYGLTRWGLRMGIRYVEKSAAEERPR